MTSSLFLDASLTHQIHEALPITGFSKVDVGEFTQFTQHLATFNIQQCTSEAFGLAFQYRMLSDRPEADTLRAVGDSSAIISGSEDL